MNLLNLLTSDYPCSLWQVRQANPNVSFPPDPTDEDLAPFDHANVHPTPQPTDYDARTERIEDSLKPQQAEDDTWQQTWIIRPATDEEITVYDLANAPEPDWMSFGIELTTHPGIAELYAAIPGPVANGLSIGLNEANKGDPRLFSVLWQQLLTSGAITPELLVDIASIANEYHLPVEFINGLVPNQPTPSEQFISDVPATPDIDSDNSNEIVSL